MEQKDFRIKMEHLPLLYEMYPETQWIKDLTDEEKRALIEKANLLIEEHFKT